MWGPQGSICVLSISFCVAGVQRGRGGGGGREFEKKKRRSARGEGKGNVLFPEFFSSSPTPSLYAPATQATLTKAWLSCFEGEGVLIFQADNMIITGKGGGGGGEQRDKPPASLTLANPSQP